MDGMGLDFARLRTAGLSNIPNVVSGDRLAAFEDQIHKVGEIECRKHGIDHTDAEPLAAAMRLGGDYRTMLFNKIKQLAILHEVTGDVLARLRDFGAFAELGIEIPSFYHTLKGDLPNDDLFDLPYHQDYRLTRCHKAYRAWIPLRDVNRIDGSIEFVIGSHRETFEYETDKSGYRFIPEQQLAGRFPIETVELARGSGVLFDPLLVHRSVPNRGKRMKFALIIQIEDAASLANPFDAADKLARLIPL